MAASHCSSGKSSHALSAPSSATFRLFLLRRVFWSIRSGGISVPPGRSCQRLFSTWLGANTTRKSASPGGTIGLKTSAPKRISLVTEPPRWLMPWISLFFTSRPQRKAAAATMSDAFNAPWPPSPAMTTFTTLFGALFGEGKARLLFERLFVRFDLTGGKQAIAARNDDADPAAFQRFLHHALEPRGVDGDRKSTRLNSSHLGISYAVFCL